MRLPRRQPRRSQRVQIPVPPPRPGWPRQWPARASYTGRDVVALLALLQVPVDPDVPDDPALARRLSAETRLQAAPPRANVPEPRLFRLGLAFGYASPLVDPDLHEGYGGSVDLALGRRLAVELRGTAAYHRYVEPLDNLGVQFISGDITLGLGYPILLRPGVRVDALAGLGPAWMTTWLGINWSLGTVAGLGVEWSLTSWFGIRLEARYHLFHLIELGGAKFYDRRSLREVGPIDRFDLPLGLVFRI